MSIGYSPNMKKIVSRTKNPSNREMVCIFSGWHDVFTLKIIGTTEAQILLERDIFVIRSN